MYFDIEGDFVELVDNLESVTLRIYGQSDIYLRRVVLSEPRSWRELEPTGGQVIRQGTMFVWPQRYSPMPPLGSMIIDETGTQWIVLKLVYKGLVKTWEAMCINLSIMLAPNADNVNANLATVLIASYGKGEANEPRAIWRGLWSGKSPPVSDPAATPTDTVPARFQPLVELSQIQFGSEFSAEKYAIYFDTPWPRELAGGEFRIVDPSGNRYRVISYTNEERLDKLPTALVVRITEGYEYFQGGTPPAIE
jgi:hypothetical protein